MNGKKARAIRRSYAVRHVRFARLTAQEVREFPRWPGGNMWFRLLELRPWAS